MLSSHDNQLFGRALAAAAAVAAVDPLMHSKLNFLTTRLGPGPYKVLRVSAPSSAGILLVRLLS